MNNSIKKAFIGLVISSVNAISFSQSLPPLITYIDGPKKPDLISISKEEAEKFSSIQEALKSRGISFKGSNDEVTFHGYWNSSIKVYIDDVLMNSPDTGKFKWEQINIEIIDSIKIDTSSTIGCISIYIYTNSKDWTKIKWNARCSTKFYKDSPFDSSKVSSGFSIPITFDSGSSIVFKESIATEHSQNHFGIRGSSENYEPKLNESYKDYKKHYKGYETFLINNSFSTEYSSINFPGTTFGFSNLISFEDANCGRKDGYYYSNENVKDVILSTSFPVFIPSQLFTLKIVPTYMWTSMNYIKDSRYSQVEDEYNIHKAVFDAHLNFHEFFFMKTNISYDYSIQKTSSSDSSVLHDLLSGNVSPEIKFSISDFGFEFGFPLSYYEPTNSLELLYKAKVNYLYQNFSFGFTVSRNCTNPVFQQLYYAGAGGKGNPNLRNEIAYNFEFPVSYSKDFDFSARPFLIFYDDKIAWKSTNEIWSPQNIGSSINWGADFFVSSKNLIPHLMLSANYSICRAFLTTDEKVYGNQIMLTPVHSFNFTATSNFGSFTWINSFSFESQKYISNENKESICPKYYLDSSVSWTKGMWTVQVIWKNILDFAYIEYGNVPQSGTSLSIGVSLKN